MAVLVNKSTKEKVLLRHHHLFGRNKNAVNSVLEDRCVSQIHGTVRWEESRWVVIDHSRNGIWLNGRRVKCSEQAVISVGHTLQFGSPSQPQWLVECIDEPGPTLMPVNHDGALVKLIKFHALPCISQPDILIYQSSDGRWMWEGQDGPEFLVEGDVIQSDALQWVFGSGGSIDMTIEGRLGKLYAPDDFLFEFDVSLDEEHVSLQVSLGNDVWKLEERTHHYLLLLLARQRIQHVKEGYDESNQGWLDMQKFVKMLGLDTSHVNIQVYRARKQISEALLDITLPNQIIERRTGEMRIGFSRFKITQGSTLVHGDLTRGELVN
ncbi:hypothetical protein A9Q99_24975 [Gammaproteobacteria bacterium 45_16_T64]|nr:hypothetical protein A9Q99_24975 [Gammaproteobacteria bacterium 45_16_T64]